MTKDIMSNLIVPGLLAVLLAFAAYVWNDLDSGIKAIDEKAEKINVTLEEHTKSIFTLRNYLSLTDQNFRDFIESVNKLKELNDYEFNILQAQFRVADERGNEPFEMISIELQEVIKEHNINDMDLMTYKAAGAVALTELR